MMLLPNGAAGLLAGLLLAGAPLPLSAQDAVPVQPQGIIGDAAGSGGYPAIAEARSDAPGYTIYRPLDLPNHKLPLVLWGNGGCRDNGLSASHFLRQIASRGYFVIANGTPRQERAVLAALPEVNGPPIPPPGADMTPPRAAPDETQVSQLLAAIDWAVAADADRDGRYYDRIDTSRIAVMGHSCGGLQALAAGADPRIDTVVALASGVYNRGASPPGNVQITKQDLALLHTPVAYILGGPADIAFANGSDDVARIDHVPVFLGSLPVGHGGTLALTDGGAWAQVAGAWLDWQLLGRREASRWFVGEDCRLCSDVEWEIVRNCFPPDGDTDVTPSFPPAGIRAEPLCCA